MHLVIKNLSQFDETEALTAGVAKLIFDCCDEVHIGVNWLLKFDSPPKLVVRSIKTLPGQIMGLNIFWKSLKGPTQGTLHKKPLSLE